MITRETIQRLIHRAPNGNPVMSLYLDMSVNTDNKRTYQVFLQQRRNEHAQLDSDRVTHHREPLGEAFEQVESWIESNFTESNRGLALFMELGGSLVEALQLPVAVPNRMVIAEWPVVGPLALVLSRHRHYGIALVDREHCRLLGFYLGTLKTHKEIEPEAYPAPHDVKQGGYAAKGIQKYKAEEARQFFKQFAGELVQLDRRLRFDHWIVLGTKENVSNFVDFLPPAQKERVVHSAQASVDASDTDVLERLTPFFVDQVSKDEAAVVDLLRDRLRTRHLATTGVRDTLEQLQEGKVETLVLARDFARHGAQCLRCGFYLEGFDGKCPYCGGDLRDGIDLAESMIRLAAEQEIDLEFVDPAPLSQLDGVAALLKF